MQLQFGRDPVDSEIGTTTVCAYLCRGGGVARVVEIMPSLDNERRPFLVGLLKKATGSSSRSSSSHKIDRPIFFEGPPMHLSNTVCMP